MNNLSAIISDSYRLTPADYLKISAGAMLPTLAIAITIIFTASVIASFFDIRMLFVALIIIFIIAPMVIAHLYFSALLTPEAREALATRHVEIIPGKQITTIYRCDEAPAIPDDTIAWHDILHTKITSTMLLIYRKDRKTPLAIPIKYLPANPIMEIFVDTIATDVCPLDKNS